MRLCEVLLVSPSSKLGRDSSAYAVGSSSPSPVSWGTGNSMRADMCQGDTARGLSSETEVFLRAVRPCAVPCQAAPRVCSSGIPVWCCSYCPSTPACAGMSQSSPTRCCTVRQSCTLSHTMLEQRWLFAVKQLKDCCRELLWLGVLWEWKEGVGDRDHFFHRTAGKIVAEPMDKLTIFLGPTLLSVEWKAIWQLTPGKRRLLTSWSFCHREFLPLTWSNSMVSLGIVSIPLTASSSGLMFSLLASIVTDFFPPSDRLLLVSAFTRL